MITDGTRLRISGGDGVYFTRLSALGGFSSDFEATAEMAMESLRELITGLSGDNVLVVDCSFFHPPKAFSALLKDVFTPQNGRPTVFLKNCEDAFLGDIQGMAQNFRLGNEEESDLGVVCSVIEKTFGMNVKDQTSGNYLMKAKTSSTNPNQRIKDALSIEERYFREITVGASGLIDAGSNKERLRSTPIRSSRFFDASVILGDPTKYIWVIARLTSDLQRLTRIIHKKYGSKLKLKRMPRLIACTTNGVAIASGIHSLIPPGEENNDIKLDVIDKLGPTPRMVEEYYGGVKEEQDNDGSDWYVYVGDYTIAGTELRIVESYAHYHGVPLLGGIVLGSVLYFLDKNDKIDEISGDHVVEGRFSVFPLVPLAQLELSPQLTYSFP